MIHPTLDAFYNTHYSIFPSIADTTLPSLLPLYYIIFLSESQRDKRNKVKDSKGAIRLPKRKRASLCITMPGSHGSDSPTSDWCTTEGTRLQNVCLPGPQRLWVTLNDANKLETKQKRLQMAQCGVTGPTSLFAESAHTTSSGKNKNQLNE